MAHQAPPTIIIAISGVSGSGKTTLVQHVAALLHHASPMFFDDYDQTAHWPPDLDHWITSGAPADAVDTPQLAADLAALRRGEMITLPYHKGQLPSPPFIVLEEPFGRTRPQLAPLLDFVVGIDLPPEVALARRLLRDMHQHFKDKPKDQVVAYLENYLPWYRDHGYTLYRAVNTRALKTADLVVNGLHPIDELAHTVVHAVNARFP